MDEFILKTTTRTGNTYNIQEGETIGPTSQGQKQGLDQGKRWRWEGETKPSERRGAGVERKITKDIFL